MDQTKITTLAHVPESAVDWARREIRLRLDEWDEFEALVLANPDLVDGSEALKRYDTLYERTCYAFQEIMKIALYAQLELEDETDGYSATHLMRGIIHYLTGDSTNIEIVKRS